MQNIIDKSITYKIVNIKSEILFREAEDDFFYFFHPNKAMKKLKEAIELTPYHFKSLMLYADICFVKGFIKKALELYKRAYEISPEDYKVLASLANCYNSMNDSSLSVFYCDEALKRFDNQNYSLYSQLAEIKISNLVKLKRYKDAYNTFIQSQEILESVSLRSIYTTDYDTINEKMELQKKLHFSGLKIV